MTVDTEGFRTINKEHRGERIFARLRLVCQEQAKRRLAQERERLDWELERRAHARPLFSDWAKRFLLESKYKRTRANIAWHLELLSRYVGDLEIRKVHDETLRPLIEARLADGVSATTIKRTLEVARAILHRAARAYRDADGFPWLETAPPLITMLRESPRLAHPINWDEQDQIFRRLPDHLARMALFAVNTGLRDSNLCGLQWPVLVQRRTPARLRCCRRRPMTKRQDRDAIYVKRQFNTEIIVLCVRWYITYRLSYRDLVAMMAERGVIISHTTIMRWVIRYVPEFEKRWNRFARSIGSSWRVDETYISIKGKWHYLYRAVDKQGRSIDFMLRPDRGIAAAQAFFRKALASHPDRAPRKVTVDGHVPSHRALRLLRREHPAWRRVTVRSSKYLNNIIEQDHRAIKRRCASMKGFKSFANAAVTIAGVELAIRIHKHQFSIGRDRPRNDSSLRTDWERAIA